MNFLDHVTSRSAPAWSGELVRQRLVDAFNIEKRLPGPRGHVRLASAWPATPLHSFADVVGWDNTGDTARDRNWQSWEHAKAAYPIEISLMEESFDWLRWLPDGERKCLDAWAKCEAFGIPQVKVMRRQGWKKTTFYRLVSDGSLRISCRLNREGVQVR